MVSAAACIAPHFATSCICSRFQMTHTHTLYSLTEWKSLVGLHTHDEVGDEASACPRYTQTFAGGVESVSWMTVPSNQRGAISCG